MNLDQSEQPPTTRRENPEVHPKWLNCVNAVGKEALKCLTVWRAYSMEFCLALKKLLLIGLIDGRIAFPIRNPQDEIIGCHHRPLAREGSWLVTPFNASSIEMFPLAVGEPHTKRTVMVFESQWDMFALLEQGLWHTGELNEFGFLATRGAMNGRRVADYCRPDTLVLAFAQNDKPGSDWFYRVMKAAPGEVRRVQIPPEHKDLNDWTRRGAKWQEIERAILAAETVKDRMPASSGGEDVEYAYPGQRVLQTGKDGRILVLLPIKNRLLSEFAFDMGRALAGKGLYSRGGLVFLLDAVARSLALVTPDVFRTWVEQHLVCYTIQESDDGPPLRVRKTMPRSDAGAVLASPQFLAQLPAIRKLNQVRLPVLRKSGAIELLPCGFDKESNTFTFDTPGLEFPKEMSLDQAKQVLDSLFREFCFCEDGGRSFAVVVAGLLTMFAYGLLPEGALAPCFMVIANAEGAGKTLLVKVMVTPVSGSFVTGSKPQGEDELRKRLTVAVMDGKAYEVLDNVKEHLDSPSLEAFLTSSTWTDRVLGSSKSFTGEKNTVLFITGNSCTVSPDMRRRSLFVELFMREERAELRQFKQSLDIPYLLEKRGEILSALWTLVQAWDRKGRPIGSEPHSSYPEWTRTIAAIVERVGYRSPVEVPKTGWDVDKDGADMRKLMAALAGDTHAGQPTDTPPSGTPEGQWQDGLSRDGSEKEFTFMELVERARRAGAFESLIGADGDQAELDRKLKTTFSRILTRYNGRFIGDYVFLAKGHGHSRRYVVRKNSLDSMTPPELR